MVEATCDIIAMSLKDEGYILKDDYTNIEKWGKLVEDSELSKYIKTANDLRNRLEHYYNGINDKLPLESILDIIPRIERFV